MESATLRPMTDEGSTATAKDSGLLSLRIDLPRGRVGPGKIDLLEAIDREGSISAAGRALGMSYKRAWDLVDALNRLLGQAAVAASPGGHRGGGATLTEAGHSLVADYRAIERAAQRAAEPRLAALMRRAKEAQTATE
ncbi:winged helix-turn-helix domain-containing protein [Belnapia arida]|nr:LysR family transcriptional regulator [Belnapia arida]